MELFAPQYTLPVVVLCAWLGLRQGAQLRARGFTVRQRLNFRDLPGIAAIIPAIVVIVPPFLLLRKYPEWYWYLPLSVQLHASGVVWALMLCCFFHIAGIVITVASAMAARHLLPALLTIGVLSGATEYLVRQSPFLQPPTLRDPLVRDGVVYQTSDATCAAAAVANIAGLFGQPRTEREMVELMGTTAFGTNIAQVYDGLRKIGLTGRAVRVSDRDFNALHAPAVLFVDYGSDALGHAVCYVGTKDGHAEIWNSQGGKSFQTRDGLAAQWRGHAMEVYQDGE